jgi:tetratricopeptide (TPR) repeat protein
MARLPERYPDDSEAAIFYALALNMAEDLSDKTYARQIKAAAILEREAQQQPGHPGLPHYIIHSYDYAPIAERGLDAARRYAEVAPSAPHALHMPSHIFSMLGLWQDSIRSNLTSKAAYEAYNEKFYGGASDTGRLHSMDFLIYAYLQGAQDQAAKGILDERNAIGKFVVNRLAGDTAHAAIPVRYAIERGDWNAAAAIEPFRSRYPQAEAISYFGRALGAARSGDTASAYAAIGELDGRRTKLEDTKPAYWADQVDIQIETALAWTAMAEGQTDQAMALMQQAADRDDASEKHVAMENRLVPMRELLAEMLLETNQPAPALSAFEAALKIAPNRYRSIAGAAEAAERLGDQDAARQWREKLIALVGDADTQRPEIVKARQSVPAPSKG